MRSSPIVVGYDGSPAAHGALRWAAEAAARHREALRIVYAAHPTSPPVINLRWNAFTAPHLWGQNPIPEAVVARGVDGAEAHATPAHPVAGLVVDGPATEVLQDQSTGAHLLVIGASRPGTRPGSTSRGIAAHAACPVVAVPDRDPAHEPSGPVVVGVDDSAQAQLAIEFALAEAAAYGCPVIAARIWTPEPPPGHEPARAHLLRTAERAAAEHDILADALRGWPEKHPDVTLTPTLIAGDAGPALAQLSQTARLVVTAPHRQPGRIGSVSRYLLRHAACPVALVRAAPTGPVP